MSAKRLSLAVTAVAVASIFSHSPVPRVAAADDEVPARGVIVEDYGDLTQMRPGEPVSQAKRYSPYAGRRYPTRVLWGDTHVHTSNSPDAFSGGNRFTPEETYRIALGEEFISSTGLPA